MNDLKIIEAIEVLHRFDDGGGHLHDIANAIEQRFWNGKDIRFERIAGRKEMSFWNTEELQEFVNRIIHEFPDIGTAQDPDGIRGSVKAVLLWAVDVDWGVADITLSGEVSVDEETVFNPDDGTETNWFAANTAMGLLRLAIGQGSDAP
jgi:hypothetical protein